MEKTAHGACSPPVAGLTLAVAGASEPQGQGAWEGGPKIARVCLLAWFCLKVASHHLACLAGFEAKYLFLSGISVVLQRPCWGHMCMLPGVVVWASPTLTPCPKLF
jgi:hypothetical protein